MKKIFAGQNKLSVYLAVILLVNLLLLGLPLFNIPGFEFSFANSILLVFLSGIYSIGYITGGKFTENKILPLPYPVFIAFLLLPLAVTLINSFFGMMCSLKQGLLFYLILTVPSVFIGYSLGLFCTAHFKRFRVLIFIVLFIMIISIPLFEFYFNPQVYFFNPVFGYFPGTIYDEGIRIGFRMISYRLLNVVYFFVVAFLSWKIYKGGSGLSHRVSFLTILLIAVVFVFTSPFLGYSTTNSRLHHLLSKEVVTEHFKIYMPHNLPDANAGEIGLEHEYQYHQLAEFFGYKPEGKIVSYVFAGEYQKGEYFGSANADVAKPWLGQIYISLGSYNQTLRHELAHVFSARFGTGIFEVAHGLNPALIEGIAVAADPYYGDNTIDYMAALAYKNGFKIKIENLFSGLNFFGRVSSISYIYAGSFSRFLIGQYGINKFAQFYSGGDFPKIYGEQLSESAESYFKFLDTINPDSAKAKAYYYFGRQTIFQKVCPRYIADRLREGWEAFAQKKYSESEKIFGEILGRTANYSALIGLSANYSAMDKNKEAAALLEKWIGKFSKTAYYYNIELKLADNLVLAGSGQRADSLYCKLLEQKPNRTLRYIAELRTFLIKRPGLLNKYLAGGDSLRYKMLVGIDQEKYFFSSFPVLINLAERLNINYSSFISNFGRGFMDNSYECSYAFYKLSGYMLKNSDFENARKLAALAMEYKSDENFYEILRRNFDKSVWIDYNAKEILNNLKIKYTD